MDAGSGQPAGLFWRWNRWELISTRTNAIAWAFAWRRGRDRWPPIWNFWRGRDAAGRAESNFVCLHAAQRGHLGEIAIRHRLTGPNLCLIGGDDVLAEAGDLLRRGEVEACLCVWCNVITPGAGGNNSRALVAARACALFLGGGGREIASGWRKKMTVTSSHYVRRHSAAPNSAR